MIQVVPDKRFLNQEPVINPLSAGTVFMRQNLTSEDVIFWRKRRHILTYKNGPRAEGIKTFKMVVDP